MNKLLVANWKMNPQSQDEAVKLTEGIDKKGVVICPPFVFLEAVGKVLKNAELGAQDAFWEEKGAYTGEISPLILKDAGVKYVIIGHSERRRHMGETDEMINKKVLTALKAGLKVILCIGEPKEVRSKGLAAAQKYVGVQLEKDLAGISPSSDLTVAYEPIWAIGTGIPDKPEETVQMAKFIKEFLYTTYHLPHTKVLYGGSVNGQNAESFLKNEEIDGALVGGASLKEEFLKIVSSVL